MTRSPRFVETRIGSSRALWTPGLAGLCLICLGVLAGGCSTHSSKERQQYILEAVRSGQSLRPVVDGTLEVHRFSVDAAFTARNLVYRLGRFEYETDAYRQFLIAPGTMITEQTRAWLADSGLFQRVVPAGSRIAPDYTLEGNVTALYGDFSDESAPAAVMEMRLFLLDNSGGTEKVAFAQTYHAATPVSDRTTEVFVEALNRSLVDILGRLESDLQREFSAKTVIAPSPKPQ